MSDGRSSTRAGLPSIAGARPRRNVRTRARRRRTRGPPIAVRSVGPGKQAIPSRRRGLAVELLEAWCIPASIVADRDAPSRTQEPRICRVSWGDGRAGAGHPESGACARGEHRRRCQSVSRYGKSCNGCGSELSFYCLLPPPPLQGQPIGRLGLRPIVGASRGIVHEAIRA